MLLLLFSCTTLKFAIGDLVWSLATDCALVHFLQKKSTKVFCTIDNRKIAFRRATA